MAFSAALGRSGGWNTAALGAAGVAAVGVAAVGVAAAGAGAEDATLDGGWKAAGFTTCG